MDKSALLELRAFTVLRDEEPVFAPVSFKLHEGETACLTGPNGSGKSTLLRALANLPYDSEGSLIRGDDNHREPTTLFLGHRSGLSARLTGHENLSAYANLQPGGQAERAREALSQVGMKGWEDEQVRNLSAGQKRRLALARLLVTSATLWLLDEPTANLDDAGRKLVDTLIQRHVDGGGGAIISSHHHRSADHDVALA